LSADAVQLKLICELEAAVAVKLLGALGGVVSDPLPVVAYDALEYPLKFPAASLARTRKP
jgi:hypothetical protein